LARKRRKSEPENHERWLVSYADFITLLFAFFVVMYAISQTDLKKMRQVAESMKKAFHAPPSAPTTDDSMEWDRGAPPTEERKSSPETPPEMESLKEQLEESLALSLPVEAKERARVLLQGQGLVLKLSMPELFEPGRALIAPDLLPLFDQVAGTLKASGYAIQVEGHADSHEAKLPGVRDLWSLSSERALGVVRDWERRLGFDPQRLSVSGRGASKPAAEGKSEPAQALNRRIEIWVQAE
jgi:chemotaxis protein MotB